MFFLYQLFNLDESPFESSKPCLMESVNGNALFFFLLANIFTGLVNLVLPTSEISNDIQSTTIILLYIFVTTAIIHGYSRWRMRK